MDKVLQLSFKNIETRAEIHELAGLAYGIWHEYWDERISKKQTDYMIEKFQSVEAITKQLSDEKYIYKILKNQTDNIGYFGIAPKSDSGDYLFLSKLYIKKEYRAMGFGKKMFREIIAVAKSLRLSKIRLTVNKYNENTIEAYKKWGYKIVEEVVTDIGEGFVMDDYIMECSL